MAQFWGQLRDHLASGKPAFLGLVGDHSDHSPGTRGAKLFVRPDGTTQGTIGGGIMEGQLMQHAVESLEMVEAGGEFSPRYQQLFHRSKGPGTKSGLGCAGEQTNVYLICDPERDLDVVTAIAQRVEADEPGFVQVDSAGLRLADEATIKGPWAPIRMRIDQDDWRYEMQLLNWKRVAIFGGGHCSRALSQVLSTVGYAVTVFDTRADLFTFAGNEHARHRIVVDDFKEAGALLKYPQWTHVVVMTCSQKTDVRALLGVIDRPFPYIGVMGSPAKLAQIRRDLAKEGVEKTKFEKVRAPIGLPITSNTPEEIAISIAAELLAERPTLFPMI